MPEIRLLSGPQEKQLSEVSARAKKAEQTAEVLREANERLNLEREAEVVQLTKQMDALRKRQTQTQNEQGRTDGRAKDKIGKRKIFFLKVLQCIIRCYLTFF